MNELENSAASNSTWHSELARFREEIKAGRREAPKSGKIQPATFERSMHFAKFVMLHDDLLAIIKRRFVDQIDVDEDNSALNDFKSYYQIKFGLNHVNTLGLTIVWAAIGGIVLGKYSGAEDKNFQREIETAVRVHANRSFRKIAGVKPRK